MRAEQALYNTNIGASISPTEKRFLLLVTFLPLCFGTILATIAVYSTLFKSIMLSYLDYVFCLERKSGQETCPRDHLKYHSVTTCIVDLVMFDIFNIVLMVSTLSPQPARKFWRNCLTKIIRCGRKSSAAGVESRGHSFRMNRSKVIRESRGDAYRRTLSDSAAMAWMVVIETRTNNGDSYFVGMKCWRCVSCLRIVVTLLDSRIQSDRVL